MSYAVKCCGDRVIEEIKAREPKLVIALGDMPLRKLAPDLGYSVTDLEGRIVPSIVGPLLVLRHPAYFWRNPREFQDFVECIDSARRFMSGNYQQCMDPEVIEITSENISEVLNYLDKFEEIAVDTETTGLKPYGWDPDHILDLGLAGEISKAIIVMPPYIQEFKRLLEEKKCIFWNAPFDYAFLRNEYGIDSNIYFDGILAHYSIDERGEAKHGLKRCARIYLGAGDWEEDAKMYAGRGADVDYSRIPTDIRHKYLSKDVTYTLQMKYVLEQELNRKVFDRFLMPAERMFAQIRHKGMRVDPVRIIKMLPAIESDLNKIDRELFELTGEYINPNSPKQVKELVYGKLEIPIDSFFGETTGKEALAPYKEDPIIGRILDYRELSKLKGTYIEGFAKWVDRDFRIHPQINLFKSVTGRLSSSDPSIMNIKTSKDLKRIFLPDNIFLYGDISGNELRWYGIQGKDEFIRELLWKGYQALLDGKSKQEREQYDIHHQVGLVAYGGSDELARKFRTVVKAGVFGQIYQRSRASMARTFGEDNVDQVMAAVSKVVPGIKNYYKAVMDEIRETGAISSYFGRQRRFGLITPEIRKAVEREAVNSPIQSAGSDLMLLCMMHLWDNRKKWDIWPFWPVHDSITMDGPTEKILPEIKKELETYCLDVVENTVPFIWEMDWGVNWSLDKPGEVPELNFSQAQLEEMQARQIGQEEFKRETK